MRPDLKGVNLITVRRGAAQTMTKGDVQALHMQLVRRSRRSEADAVQHVPCHRRATSAHGCLLDAVAQVVSAAGVQEKTLVVQVCS